MSSNFDVALAKGEYAEGIVRRWLETRGWVVYQPMTDKAHAFDVLAIKDKRDCIALDIKAKARRTKYPDTGIDIRHYETYKQFAAKHTMPFWICFVDEYLKQIYGNSLDALDMPLIVGGVQYPFVKYNIRFWPVVPERMKILHYLTDKECEELKALSQRSYDYVVPVITAPKPFTAQPRLFE